MSQSLIKFYLEKETIPRQGEDPSMNDTTILDLRFIPDLHPKGVIDPDAPYPEMEGDSEIGHPLSGEIKGLYNDYYDWYYRS
jgi:hypothetical protein